MTQQGETLRYIPQNEAVNLAASMLLTYYEDKPKVFDHEVTENILLQYYLLLLAGATPKELFSEERLVLDPESAILLSVLHWHKNEELRAIMEPLHDAVEHKITNSVVWKRIQEIIDLLATEKEKFVESFGNQIGKAATVPENK